MPNEHTPLADLHIHSTYTDGSYTPPEIVELAKKASLSAIAITDHDNINAYHEAKEPAAKAGIKLITGIEMSVNFRGGKIHMLGLGFDIDSPKFLADYKRFRQPKEACIKNMMDYLKSIDFKLTFDDLKPYTKNDTIDRYTFFRYFTDHKICAKPQQIWDEYLNPGIKGININIEAPEAIKIIHDAGGKTSLAHFHKSLGLKRFNDREKEECLLELKSLGLDALEAEYPDFTAKDHEFINQMAEKHGFQKTGGTDFHGANRPQVKLGSGENGNVAVPLAWAENILR
jgi:hypothetical protein